MPDGIPFAEDVVHRSYEPEWAHRFWQVLVCVDRVLKEHRARFRGKTSPVQLWWGSFDLAYSRFSGRLADSEQSAVGFWPGDARFPEAAFYAYTLPKPEGIESAAVEPAAASWSVELGEFLLGYDAVRESPDPRRSLLSFLESTYRAGAERAGWEPCARARRRAGLAARVARSSSAATRSSARLPARGDRALYRRSTGAEPRVQASLLSLEGEHDPCTPSSLRSQRALAAAALRRGGRPRDRRRLRGRRLGRSRLAALARRRERVSFPPR